MADMPPAPADGGGQDGGSPEEAIQAVGAALQKLAEAAPEAFGPVLDAFQAAVEKMSGGEGAEPGQTTTPEQGGNPNAVPMSMERR